MLKNATNRLYITMEIIERQEFFHISAFINNEIKRRQNKSYAYRKQISNIRI